MKVLKEDQTEVEIMETIDYGDTDMRSVIEGDRKYEEEENSFSQFGFSQQEIEGDEIVDVEEDDEDVFLDLEETLDDEE